MFISKSFSKAFFVLDFVINAYPTSCYDVHYFITEF